MNKEFKIMHKIDDELLEEMVIEAVEVAKMASEIVKIHGVDSVDYRVLSEELKWLKETIHFQHELRKNEMKQE